MTNPTMHLDHAKMAAVVKRLDALLDELNSKGTSGSYASIQDAAELAQAVCSVNQKEMGELVTSYNTGFGHAANEYQSLCQTLVSIRNSVAQTANIHLSNDEIQGKAFAPLKAESWKSATGNDNPSSPGSSTSGSGGGNHTTVEAPGPLGQTGGHATTNETQV